MYRLATILLAAAVLALPACQKKEDPETRVEEPYTPLAEMETTPAATTDWDAGDETSSSSTEWDRPQPRQATRVAYAEPAGEDEVLTPVGGRTYSVKKGDTLYGLARRFYGDQSKWKTIWKANRARLADPNRLRVGMKLIIP